jgi:hypothetical protein
MTAPVIILCLLIFPLLLAWGTTRTAPDGRKELDKTDRREAARRAVDNLLRYSELTCHTGLS